jgi:predicted metal-dependent peptidase
MPSGVSEIMGELVIAVDMSGSIGDREVAQFLGEITAICETVRPEKLRLLYWDTAVCQDEKYEREELINLAASTRPAGGGGTSPSCITDYMVSEGIKPQVCVVLTDGWVGSYWGGAWPCPVLWCIAGNKTAQPTTGSAVHIDWNN